MIHVAGKTQLDYWCKCKRCKDQFTIYFWGYRDPKRGNEWFAEVEPSSNIIIEEGIPYHRCGGVLEYIGISEKLNILR